MTYVYPTLPYTTWNGPICPSCGRGYTQTSTFTFPYQPKHRKPGPAH
jgi:hypothetical protein